MRAEPFYRTTRRVAAALAIAALAMGASSCGSKAAPAGGLDVSDGPEVIALPDTGTLPDVPLADSGGPADGVVSDGTGPDLGSEDAGPLDCSATPHPAGCACAAAAECESKACIPTRAGMACAAECAFEACPAGRVCQPVGPAEAGANLLFLCVERTPFLCRPCATSADCAAVGFEGADKCLSYGDAGSFCGIACDGAHPCPEGYTCGSEGQCLASVGDCACAPLHVALGASTACAHTNAAGQCDGTRTCTAAGLTPCDASTPAVEECDLTDNDCDGYTDEAVDTQCAITNAFGSCPGKVLCTAGTPICQGAPPVAETCDGGDNDCDGQVDEGSPDADLDLLADCVDPDDDGDGKVDGQDLCPLDPDPGQEDTDADGKGDACDPDDDGDGVNDGQDCKPLLKFVFPFAPELCDGVDNDCDGQTDEKSCEDGNACTDDVCDPVSGCSYPFNTTICNDLNPCTTNDLCTAGACAGTFLACNDQNPCTNDGCDPLVGCKNTPNTLPCTDGNACTQADQCAGGACLPGGPLPCEDGNACTLDSCDAKAGCQKAPLGGACSDGNACTTGDVCVGGACTGAFGSCDDGNACTLDSCDVAKGCQHEATPGGLCDDGNACTEGDHCDAGACTGDDVGCQCEKDADCLGFEDGNLCNGILHCDMSQAPFKCAVKPASQVVCPLPVGLSATCASSVCDPGTGLCGTKIGPDAVVCSDGSACTQGDHCQGGACQGTTTACNDGNACTSDLCDPLKGCVYEATLGGKACDDGNACTKGDVCDGATCGGKTPVLCNDGLACTADSCDPSSGCKFAPTSGLPCEDGSACTSFDSCLGGVCVGTSLACDDGNLCNGKETCDPAGGCMAGTALLCDDGVACTIDSCDKAAGCKVKANDAACDDKLFCNGIEACAPASGCVAGAPVAISDGVDCTSDACDEVTKSVLHTPSASACNDGVPCTTDTCDLKLGCLHADTGNCLIGATASVRFVSVAAVVKGQTVTARLVSTPPAGGTVVATGKLKAIFSALAQAMGLWK